MVRHAWYELTVGATLSTCGPMAVSTASCEARDLTAGDDERQNSSNPFISKAREGLLSSPQRSDSSHAVDQLIVHAYTGKERYRRNIPR